VISLLTPSEIKEPTSLAIGSFDGLHEGHRTLIKNVVNENKYTPTVASFWPHPREILYQETRLRLDLPSEKLPLLENLGIKQLVLIPFDLKLSRLSAEEFISDILINQLQARTISVGENFRFGYKRSGDINTMKNSLKDKNIKLNVVPLLEDQEGRISSSRVRQLLLQSDLLKAKALLKRPYSFSGRVIRGKGIGEKIGFPTANLQIDGRKFLPGEGVYAAWTKILSSEDKFPSVMNLGPQPTINPLSPSAVEVHIIDKNIDLYGVELLVEPVKMIRTQIKFSNIEELSNQISKDKALAKSFLKKINN
tara:strand:+ start:184 stop:1107 length:924 start_codon:yes stop_codon:yes gene_type:complete